MYKIKINEKSKVTARLRTGKDLVGTELFAAEAQKIINSGKPTKGIDGFPIGVDDKWFFEGEEIPAENASAAMEAPADEPPSTRKRGKKNGR